MTNRTNTKELEAKRIRMAVVAAASASVLLAAFAIFRSCAPTSTGVSMTAPEGAKTGRQAELERTRR